VDEEGEVGKMGQRSRREGRQDPGQGIGGRIPRRRAKEAWETGLRTHRRSQESGRKANPSDKPTSHRTTSFAIPSISPAPDEARRNAQSDAA